MKLLVGVAAQGVTSLSNFAVSLTVAQTLGVERFGMFALYMMLTLFFVSMQTVWVGDSYAVLDRVDTSVRGAIWTWQTIHMVAALVLGTASALAFAREGMVTSLLVGIMIACWQFQEVTRRVAMVHGQFGVQAVIDTTYLLTTPGLIILGAQVFSQSIDIPILAVSVGSVLAAIIGRLLLPREQQYPLGFVQRHSLRTVSTYGAWRAAGSGSGYATQLAIRIMVIAAASTVALGNLEAAKLVSAPLAILVAGVQNVLLPHFVSLRDASVEYSTIRSSTYKCASAMLAIGALYTIVATFIGYSIMRSTLPEDFDVSRLAVLGWCVALTVAAATGPFYVAATVVLSGRAIFVNRLLANVATLGLSALALSSGSPDLVAAAQGVAFLVFVVPIVSATRRSPRWRQSPS